MEKNQLENSRVLKPISGNVVIRKVKTKTSHDGKERSTNMTSLKMIVKQGIDKKLQIKDWKTSLLNRLTSEIAQIYKAYNIAMEL